MGSTRDDISSLLAAVNHAREGAGSTAEKEIRLTGRVEDDPNDPAASLYEVDTAMANALEGLPPELLAALNAAGSGSEGGDAPAKRDDGGIDIDPVPSFVVKTSDETGRKVFVNVCGHPFVPLPGHWTANENSVDGAGIVPEEVEKAIAAAAEEDGAGADALRFPVSLGEARNDLDKKGVPCTVYDVVLNEEIIEAASKSRQVKHFIVELSCGWVTQKHGIGLDSKYRLPKLTSKGTVAKQRIRRKGADLSKMRKEKKNSQDNKVLVEEVVADGTSGSVENDEPTFGLRTKRAKKKVDDNSRPIQQQSQKTGQNQKKSPSIAIPSINAPDNTGTLITETEINTRPEQFGSRKPKIIELSNEEDKTSVDQAIQMPCMRYRIEYPDMPATKAVISVLLMPCKLHAAKGMSCDAPPTVSVLANENNVRVQCSPPECESIESSSSNNGTLELSLPLIIDFDSATVRVCRKTMSEDDLEVSKWKGALRKESHATVLRPGKIWCANLTLPFISHTSYLEKLKKYLPHNPGEIKFKSASTSVI